jgi:hypothetical protein
MADIISRKKWILLGFGVISIVFLFLPVANGELYDYYVISLVGSWGTLLLLSLIYFIILVPFNAIFNKFYSTNYYDTIIKAMNVIIPILGLIALLSFRSIMNLSPNETFTWVYYALFALIIIEHGYNIYITFYSLY